MGSFNFKTSSVNHQLHNKLTLNLSLATVRFSSSDGFFSFPLLLVSFLIFSPFFPMAKAQESPPPPGFYTARLSSSMAIIIIILIAALFFMGFFSVYIRHRNAPAGQTIRQTLSMRRRGAVAAARGLDASVIETFPTFSYAEVKDQRIGKGGLECAVCLNEFEDDETLRLIPKCDHVFHPECIDAWLESHVTCPVCRANLTPVFEEEAAETVAEGDANTQQVEVTIQEQPGQDEVAIRIDSQDDDRNARPEVANPGLARIGSLNRGPPRSSSIRKPKMFSFGKFRSHSTGHSLVVPSENLDRFTLRLPEGVRKEMLNRALLSRNESCARRLQGEGSTRGVNRTGGDGSNRGVRFNPRRIDIPGRGARSDRWAFFTRALSMKSPKENCSGSTHGPGSTSKSPKTVVKMPSFKCLEPKSSDEMETSLVRSDSARTPV